jgi:hypothetical protein
MPTYTKPQSPCPPCISKNSSLTVGLNPNNSRLYE